MVRVCPRALGSETLPKTIFKALAPPPWGPSPHYSAQWSSFSKVCTIWLEHYNRKNTHNEKYDVGAENLQRLHHYVTVDQLFIHNRIATIT